jgi:EAL domain-containing protein (putative c-di-GMP-specific phosphodiesterase class I)
MGEFSEMIDSVAVEAYFQKYHLVDFPDITEGELLTRPDTGKSTQAYFEDLAIEHHFETLTWLIQVQSALHRELGAQVSVNIHNSLVSSEKHRERFLSVIALAATPAVFEFTETHPMPPVEASNHLLRAIRELGHKTALDDFGSGLNGMSLLTDYDFDIVKLDRSLAIDLKLRVEKQKTLRLVHEMLVILGKDHIVEGIEDEETFHILRDAGYRNFQGYLFSKPRPVSEMGISLHQGSGSEGAQS